MPAPAVPTRLRAHRWAWWLLAGLVLGLLLSMAWGARSVYQQREQRYHHQIEGGLRAISLLQVRNVADWRRQHIADAAALAEASRPSSVDLPSMVMFFTSSHNFDVPARITSSRKSSSSPQRFISGRISSLIFFRI